MASYDIEGYLMQGDLYSDQDTHRSRRHIWISCFAVVSLGVAVASWEIRPGGLQSINGIDNLLAWPSSMQGKAQLHAGFRRSGPSAQRGGYQRLQAKLPLQPLQLRPPLARDVRLWAEAEDTSERVKVPLDSIGGLSPERKASQQLERFFTFVAVKIVLHQLESFAPNADYDQLLDFYQTVPLKDADDWVQKLMDRNRPLAFRIMEVRKAYAAQDFEWDRLKTMAVQGLSKGNEKVMKAWAEKAFALPEHQAAPR